MRLATLLVGLLGLLVGCNHAIDKEECDKMVGHMVDLLAKDRAAKIKGKVQSDASTTVEKTCVGKISKAQFECVMNAKTFDEAAGCDTK